MALLTACASTGPPGGAGELAYWVPSPNPSTYAFADTTAFTVHAGVMGDMTVTAAHEGMAEMAFRPAGAWLLVEVRIPRLSGSFDAAPDGPGRVDEHDVGGAFVLAIDPRGRFEIVDTPAMTAVLRDITGPGALVRPLFVLLPGAMVEAGSEWTDTIWSSDETLDTRSRTETVITTTLVGDTLVGGRKLLALRTRAENRLETTGRSGGVAVTQRMTGTTLGSVLWDPRRRVLVERSEEGQLTGTLEMPEAGGPLPVSAWVRRRVVARGRRQ